MAGNEQMPPVQPRAEPSSARRKTGLLVVAGAALSGIVVARVIDWRSHAHPR